MDATTLSAMWALGGVALGGGIQAGQSWWARRSDSRAVLYALVAEIEALSRLINHRGFLPALVDEANGCRALIAAGRGTEQVSGIQVSMSQNYFALFESLSGKVGLLSAYHADRIVRFYTLAKASVENLIDGSMAVRETSSAFERLALIENDILILHTVLIIGNEVAGFRRIKGASHLDLGPPTPFFASDEYFKHVEATKVSLALDPAVAITPPQADKSPHPSP